VFGTLKEGFPNHHVNLGLKIPGVFNTVERFPLYLVGRRNSPWLINDPGGGLQIAGEVYQVTFEALQQMDRLERVSASDGYCRISTEVGDRHGSTSQAEIYVKSIGQLSTAAINAGPLECYTLEHAKLYRQRENRTQP